MNMCVPFVLTPSARLFVVVFLLAPALVSVSACSGDEILGIPPVEELRLLVLSGDGQRGKQYTPLTDPVVLKVVDSAGEPIGGVQMRLAISEGGGRLSDTVLNSGPDGQVEFEWTLGDTWVQKARIKLAPGNQIEVSAEAEYLYTAPVQRSDGWKVRPLDTNDTSLKPLFDGLDAIRFGNYTNLNSLLVFKGGELLLEEYWPGVNSSGTYVEFDMDKPHEVQSASKSFRSALIGIAIDQGFISSVDEPLSTFFPEHASVFVEGKEHITLRHFLTMSSGLAWEEWQYPFGDSRNTLSTLYSMPYPYWIGYILNRPLAFDPGTRFAYNTGASIMLNDIIIRATGIPLGEFIQMYYSTPTESSTLPGVGNPLGATTTPRDMGKLGQIFLDGGMWKDQRIVSELWVQQSFVPEFDLGATGKYGFQWWIRTLRTARRSYTTQYASGNGGQFVFVIKDLDMVVVSTAGHFGSSKMNQTYTLLERNILPAFE